MGGSRRHNDLDAEISEEPFSLQAFSRRKFR